jgi:hypothetical protein
MAMQNVSGLDVLNDIQENNKMISKLLKWLSNTIAGQEWSTNQGKRRKNSLHFQNLFNT